MTAQPILDGLRRPEYTGENRCIPCTAVNVAIAVAVSIPVAAGSGPVGAALLAGCLLVIYLRGYLVPGTPELTKRYLPPAVLRLFGKEPVGKRLGTLDETGIWKALDDAGVVERREESVALAEGFRDRWWDEIREPRRREPGDRSVAELLDAENAVQRGDRAFEIGGNRLVRWDSEAALLADVAAGAVFRDRVADWSELDPDARRDLLCRLRLLLDRCPGCGASTKRAHEHGDPCCQRPHTAVWNECEGCGALLAELVVPTAGNEEELSALLERSAPAG
ncbi:MAG: hypothetical protein QXG03_11805 [Halalkalicoccus sp.]